MGELSKEEVRDLFERANRTRWDEWLTLKLYGGKQLRGPCPINGCGKGLKADGPFALNRHTGRWNCFTCNAQREFGGDLVALVHKLTSTGGETKFDTARRMAGDMASEKRETARSPAKPDVKPEDELWKAQMAIELWRDGRRAERSPVETYLRTRGGHGPILGAALRQVRFHPAAYHSGFGRNAVYLPAMVCLIRTPEGPTGGVHVTYLSPDGREKTQRRPAKRMWGPQKGPANDNGIETPGCIWLCHPEAEGPLVVAEGFENAMSAAIMVGAPCRPVAAGSLDRLQGGWATDKWGRRNPDLVKIDPLKPAWTWPEPEAAPWGEVLLAIDRDMNPLTIKCRKAQGGTYEVALGSDDRARICVALAEQWWRRAGAKRFRAIDPGPGRDFNDALRAKIAADKAGITA